LIVFKSIIRKGSPFFYTQLEFSLRNCSSLHIKLYSSNRLRRAQLFWNINFEAISVMIFKVILVDRLCTDKLTFIHKAFTIPLAGNVILNIRIIFVMLCQLIDKSLIATVISKALGANNKDMLNLFLLIIHCFLILSCLK
jgi:hypothetical protein